MTEIEQLKEENSTLKEVLNRMNTIVSGRTEVSTLEQIEEMPAALQKHLQNIYEKATKIRQETAQLDKQLGQYDAKFVQELSSDPEQQEVLRNHVWH